MTTLRFGLLVERKDRRAGLLSNELPLLSVSQTRGVRPFSEIHDGEPRADSLHNYKLVSVGDIAFNRMSVRAGALGVVGEPGVVTPEYEVLRPHDQVDERFIAYLMKSPWFVSELVKRERGIGAGGAQGVRTTRISYSDMRLIEVPRFSADEQRAIADYLDHETAEIDAFIEDLRSMLSLTRERAEAVWTSTFRELETEDGTVRVSRVLTSLVDGPFGSSLTSNSYSDEGSPVVRLGNIGRNSFFLKPRVYVPVDYAAQLSSHAVRPGDVVIAGLGDANNPVGRASVVPESFGHGIVKADCYRARPSRLISPEYLAWALSSPTMGTRFQRDSRGSTRARLNLQIVGASRIPLPDRAIQQATLESHRAMFAEHDAMATAMHSAINLARERRAALVSAAVTGQIDVTQPHRPVAEQLEDEVLERV